ncbi:MAG: DUF2330 domain-containing protein [Spirochaetota bacterium]
MKYKNYLLPTFFFFFAAPSLIAMCTMFIREPRPIFVKAPDLVRTDKGLYNESSRVIIVRDERHTVMGISSDYQGNYQNFAMIVPVPQVLQREQINIGDKKIFDKLGEFTSPRYIESFDANPCQRGNFLRNGAQKANESADRSTPTASIQDIPKTSLGIKVEASYSIGEYKIQILSAKDSQGLEVWLRQNQYSLPKGASKALEPYIKQKMKFFLAKVNLKKSLQSGRNFLRPLQFAFDSEKFMLPIRLGTVNAKHEQELLAYIFSKNGRVEASNYRTMPLPSGQQLPYAIKNDFANFYKKMFQYQATQKKNRAVFTEYFGKANECTGSHCTGKNLSKQDLRSLGVYWMNAPDFGIQPEAYVTRLHIRYTKESFPEDLMLQETSDTQTVVTSYKITKPWSGKNTCSAMSTYQSKVKSRQKQAMANLQNLTGSSEINFTSPSRQTPNKNTGEKWWKKIWN